MINIECAEFLTLNHEFQFWGDIFNYRNLQKLDIRGRFTDQTSGTNPVSSIYDQAGEFLTGLQDFDQISLNGESIGSGRILSADLDSGLDAREKLYSISLELLKTGDLYNLTGLVYNQSGIPPISDIEYVESLQESFNFNSDEDGIFNYDRSVSIEMESGKLSDPNQSARNIADIFFLHDPLITALNATYPSFYTANGQKTRSESFDIINLKFSFNESFKFQDEDPYIWSYTHSTNLDKAETTVSERGLVTSVSNSPSLYDVVTSGFNNNIKNDIYTRCNNVFQSWSGIIGANGCSLQQSPTKQGYSYDSCRGTISYDLEYTTDQSRQSCHTHSYTISTNRDNAGVYSVNENGKLCETCEVDRFSGSLARFNDPAFQSGIETRVGDTLLRSMASVPCGEAGNSGLKCVSTTKEYSEDEACINYNYSFSNDSNIIDSGNIYRVDINRSTNYPIHAVNKFNIINDKEVVQPSNQSLLATYQNNIKVIGKTGAYLSDLLTEAQNHIQKPSGKTDVYMSDASYNWEPNSRSLDLSITYGYTEHREFEDILAW